MRMQVIVVDFTLARIAILYGACLPRLSLEAFFCAIKFYNIVVKLINLSYKESQKRCLTSIVAG